MEVVMLVIWIAIFWQGTTFEQLFSKRTMIIIVTMGLFAVSTNLYYL